LEKYLNYGNCKLPEPKRINIVDININAQIFEREKSLRRRKSDINVSK